MGTIRIVAGEFRGRRLRVPPGVDVRPTADRVREALFAILGDAVRGVHVLDLYAGSGALGLEALSRGASRVTFVEHDRAAIRTRRANIASIGGASRCRLVRGRVEDVLERPGTLDEAGVIVADPPYADHPGERLLAALSRAGVIAPAGWVAIERDARGPSPPDRADRLRIVRRARYGRAAIDVFRRVAPDEPEAANPASADIAEIP